MLQLLPGGFLKVGDVGEFTSVNITDEDTGYQIDGVTVLKTGAAAELNILIGEDSGLNLDSSGGGSDGIGNVFIGKDTGKGGANSTAYRNVFIGEGAGKSITSGYENVGIGQNCLQKLANGNRNFALGKDVMQNAVAATSNVAIGNFTMDIYTGMTNNIAIGEGALRYMNQDDNVGIGYNAGHFGVNKYRNTYIGREAGYGVIGQSNSDNVMIGYRSGYSITTGGVNIFIGEHAGHNQTTNSNLLIIDNQDRGSAANEAIMALIYGLFAADPADQVLTFNANVFLSQVKAGSDQANAGAAADEIWKTSGHATLPDNVIMIGV